MAKVKLTIDEKEYTEWQFKKDITRMFDTYRHDSDHMGESSCNNVDCRECPLGDNSLTAVCAVGKSEAFDLVKSVYEWAQRNPIITNIDKLKEIFGEEKTKEIISRIMFYANNEDFGEWLSEEYKKPDQ